MSRKIRLDTTKEKRTFQCVLYNFTDQEIAVLRNAMMEGKLDGGAYWEDGDGDIFGWLIRGRYPAATDEDMRRLIGQFLNEFADDSGMMSAIEAYQLNIERGETPAKNARLFNMVVWLDKFVAWRQNNPEGKLT